MNDLQMPVPYAKMKKHLNKYDKLADEIIGYDGNPLISYLFYLYLFKKYKQECIIFGPTKKIGFNLSLSPGKSMYEIENNLNAIDAATTTIAQCLEQSKTGIIIIPIFLHLSPTESHGNLLIYRSDKGELELFEPHGDKYYGKSKIINEQISSMLTYFSVRMELLLDAKHISYKKIKIKYASDVCPMIKGLQYYEENSLKPKKSNEPGYCNIWSMFFAELCLKNPHISSEKIMELIYKTFDKMTDSEISDYLRNIARGYTYYIHDTLQKYFKEFYEIEPQLMTFISSTSKGTSKRFFIIELLLVVMNIEINMETNANYIESEITRLHEEIKMNKNLKNEEREQFLKIVLHLTENYRHKFATMSPLSTPRKKKNTIKICESGKILNKKTGRCNKIKQKKPCKSGKIRNEKTGRCIQNKTKKIKH
jgi:hypothetical protein